jgi:hypothetical protein
MYSYFFPVFLLPPYILTSSMCSCLLQIALLPIGTHNSSFIPASSR